MKKMRVIVFEGLDGAGKTTLFRAFERRNEHYYACFDRFPPISSFVYDRFFERYREEYHREGWMVSFSDMLRGEFGLVVVHVDTAPKVCWNRRREEETYTLAQYVEQQDLYYRIMGLVRGRDIPCRRVDGADHPEYNAQIIERWLEDLDQEGR
jgi:polyphosphate kinase 2 (PPK2 family)